jgi:Chitobiase/beta-hexosaminidase C-terminal domain
MTRLPFLALGLLICSSAFGQSVAIPVITPVPGSYNNTVSVTITDATPGAVIYYTIDGSAPTVSSTKYTAPFALTANATVQAIAVLPSSGVASSAFAVTTCAISGTTWKSLPFATPQTGNFQIEFDAIPAALGMDSVIGVSNAAVTGYAQLSIGVRFHTSGNIDAISGAGYTPIQAIPYVVGQKYHFTLDVAGTTYTAIVDSKIIGTGLSFRTPATTLSQLSYVAELSSASICNLKISAFTPPPPLFLVTTALPPAKAGVAYSTILAASGGKAPYTWRATNLPVGMTLTTAGVLSGTPSTSNGAFTVTATDANLANLSENLTLTIAPIPVHSVALSWNAAVGAVGYNVYRATKKINLALVTATTFTDLSVTAGTNYCYTVTSVDATATESLPSTQVCATIPTP